MLLLLLLLFVVVVVGVAVVVVVVVALAVSVCHGFNSSGFCFFRNVGTIDLTLQVLLLPIFWETVPFWSSL